MKSKYSTHVSIMGQQAGNRAEEDFLTTEAVMDRDYSIGQSGVRTVLFMLNYLFR